jgi:multicomponent Na+:H+ antiporter subunit G
MSLVGIGLILVGLFFLLVAAIGVVRLPDVFARSHAVGLTDSLGAFFLLLGLALYQGLSVNLVRIVVVPVLLYLLNPVITHATIRAALRAGLKPWTKERQLSANAVDEMVGFEGETSVRSGRAWPMKWVRADSTLAAQKPNMENLEKP